MVAGDRHSGRGHWHRIHSVGDELQSSLHQQCSDLFCGDPRAAVGEGAGDRCSGTGEQALEGGRRAVPDRSEALPVHRRPEEGGAGGGRAERQTVEGVARPGDGCCRARECAIRAGAAEF